MSNNEVTLVCTELSTAGEGHYYNAETADLGVEDLS